MSSPVDMTVIFNQFVQILPWLMLLALLPTILKSLAETIKEFRA